MDEADDPGPEIPDNFDDEYEPPRREDPKLAEARAALSRLFEEERDVVFYERQIVIRFEAEFFHWITARALHQMVEEGEIESEKLALFPEQVTGSAGVEIRFYWSKRNRYWKREAERVRRLVTSFSTEQFGRALGRHGETMFDAALPKRGFLPIQENVREFGGKVWTATRHNLDRVFVRDGVHYGTEVKNTLPYIGRDELKTKLEICAFLGLVPLFIMRAAPKSYNYEIIQRGGYVMIFDQQLYPHGYEELAREIQEGLGLPVASPVGVPMGIVDRFARWHEKKRGRT